MLNTITKALSGIQSHNKHSVLNNGIEGQSDTGSELAIRTYSPRKLYTLEREYRL